jgi:hypothetical protein
MATFVTTAARTSNPIIQNYVCEEIENRLYLGIISTLQFNFLEQPSGC